MLALSVLGPFEATYHGRPLSQLTSQRAQALLIYLAVEARQAHQREALMALLWPGFPQKSAQQSLRQTIYVLRQAIEGEEATAPLILSERFTAGLNPEAAVAVDAARFERLSAAGRPPQEWQQAADLYRGAFLQDFYLPDSEAFEAWASQRRAFYQRQMLELLQRLGDHYEGQGELRAAEGAARRQLEIDNLQEGAHRRLMQILAQDGRRQEALTHYDALRQLLWDELEIEPEAETEALVEAIRAGERPAKRPGPSPEAALIEDHLARPKHNLPHTITSFIGREEEMKELTSIISEKRLVTLTGVGGIGKTSLSMQVGRRMLEVFGDGVWLVELEAVVDPEMVAQTVFRAIGLQELSNRPALETAIDFLRDKSCLLILDNCEHVVQATAEVSQAILQACPQVRILASSREILDVPGEMPFAVPPLSMPEAQQPPQLEQWQRYEAMRLFAERAATVLPHFQVTGENLSAVAQICRRLDGIPLALELAAAKVRLLTTEQIAARLDDRFRLLTGGGRTAVARQVTLRALVDWSWELLPGSEQRLLARLAVFTGGMTLEAVEAICLGEGAGEAESLELLMQLANKSLVVVERAQGQETRFRLLETIQQYALERLAESGDETGTRQRHLEYFRRWAERVEQALMGRDQVAWLDRVGREVGNIRAAVTWARERDVESGLRLASAVWKFLWARGYVREGEIWLAGLLECAGQADARVRAKALRLQGDLNIRLFEMDRAVALLEQALGLCRTLEDKEGIAFCLYHVGRTIQMQGHLERGWELLQESLALYRELGDKPGMAEVMVTMVYNFRKAGDSYDQARSWLDESLALTRESEDLPALANTLTHYGAYALWHGDFAMAQSCLEESLALYESQGVQRGVWNLTLLGDLHSRLGRHERGRDMLEKSISIGLRIGEVMNSYWARVRLGYVHVRLGELALAQATLVDCQRQFKEVGSINGVVYATEGLAMIALRRNEAKRAAQLLGWADATRVVIEDSRPPIEHAELEQDIATIRETLDEETYAAAYTEGRAMTIEQAIALAAGDPMPS